MPSAYKPGEAEPRVTKAWDEAKPFHADPARVLSGEAKPYCIFIPPPNVTAALHLGHALNNTLQDILARAHRMMGFETLWMPGTDHAGIATQAVVEKRVWNEEKKRRHDFTREAFIEKIQAFKDEYEKTITEQLKVMGCSCDWDRQRFTMDEQCAAAVREAFFRLFCDGLIYRGKRLVNWDPELKTAVADDETDEIEIDTAFYYMRYPLVHSPNAQDSTPAASSLSASRPRPATWGELALRGYPGANRNTPGEQAWITVATTRPETYLGDAAIGMNPHDPRLKSLDGFWAELPLVGRILPIVADEYVVLPKAMARNEEEANDPKAEYATGFLKVTPAHDQNDYDLYFRRKEQIDRNSAGTGLICVMAPDASISDKFGWTDVGDAKLFLGLSREEARKKVLAEFKARSLLEETKPYKQTVKISDRSKAIIEPYLSDQWFVKVTDPRMAQTANAALVPEQRSAGAAFGGPALRAGSSRPTRTLLDSLPFRALRPSGFTGRDPYPPGQPSPADLTSTRRFLPHKELEGATYFVTWRLGNAKPLEASERDQVLEAIRHFDGDRIDVYFAVIMPDHVHCLIRPLSGHSMLDWTRSVKKFSATQVNAARSTVGSLWQDEAFDHIVRNGSDLAEFAEYLALNPVKEGLAAKPSEYRWSYVSPAMLDAMAVVEDTDVGEAPTTGTECRSTKSSRTESTGDGSLSFHPGRYAKTFEHWHDNIRDWCISRQLWWGHRIPVWSIECSDVAAGLNSAKEAINVFADCYADLDCLAVRVSGDSLQISTSSDHLADALHALGEHLSRPTLAIPEILRKDSRLELKWIADRIRNCERDPDVLDTWFSSALWPLSTLGWPDPVKYNAESNKGLLEAFNPSSVLCTAREIITLWVSRMVMFNRYLRAEEGNRQQATGSSEGTNAKFPMPNASASASDFTPGPVPFTNVFIHAVIQDGDGRKMSKSLGNGVDPRDIIESHGCDAMRFTLTQMATNTQDVRLPVALDPKTGKNSSPKFDAGRNFCNKLWNASRFALTILRRPLKEPAAGSSHSGAAGADALIDRWMLSRLHSGVKEAEAALANYEFSNYAQSLYDLLWRDFCDWYIEGIKPTVDSSPRQRAVLAHALETIVRLLHPVTPFVTEAIWEHLRHVETDVIDGFDLAPSRKGGLLCTAGWPKLADSLHDESTEREFERLRSLITAIREVRAQHNVHDKRKITLHSPPSAAAVLAIINAPNAAGLVQTLAGLESVATGKPAEGAGVSFRFEGHELFLSNLADAVDAGTERARLEKLIADLTKSISTMNGRLNNAGYIAKAPPKLVEESKAQLAKAEADLDAARAQLAGLT